MIRKNLKKVFWLHLCFGRSFQFLEIQPYSSGLRPPEKIAIRRAVPPTGKIAAALTWNQNPNFEIASNNFLKRYFDEAAI
jgi:hypothetical protein